MTCLVRRRRKQESSRILRGSSAPSAAEIHLDENAAVSTDLDRIGQEIQ